MGELSRQRIGLWVHLDGRAPLKDHADHHQLFAKAVVALLALLLERFAEVHGNRDAELDHLVVSLNRTDG